MELELELELGLGCGSSPGAVRDAPPGPAWLWGRSLCAHLRPLLVLGSSSSRGSFLPKAARLLGNAAASVSLPL